jgi:hypothetical protein
MSIFEKEMFLMEVGESPIKIEMEHMAFSLRGQTNYDY